MPEYILDPAWKHEKERLEIQASLYEEGTRQIIGSVGIAEGWTCAEVGGGTGSVAKWLCDQVGPSGRVTATDLDTRFLDAIDLPNLEVRRHNIVEEALDPSTYDLIHTRLLLEHLGEGRKPAISHMIDALKPGGWLVAEDLDTVTVTVFQPSTELTDKIHDAIGGVARAAGIDSYYGRALPADLEAAGLVSLRSEGRLTVVAAGTPEVRTLTLFLGFLRPRIEEAGLMTADEIDRLLSEAETPGSWRWFPPLMIAAWGQKPS